MPEALDRVEGGLFTPLWWAGFHPIYVFIGGIALVWYFAQVYTTNSNAIILAVFVAGVTWFTGTRYINNHYREVLDAFEEDAKREARDVLGLGGDVRAESIRFGSGSTKAVLPSHEYQFVTLLVGESSLAVHDDAELNMPLLDGHTGRNTREFYYDQITSVNYDEPHLQIKSTTGELIQYRCSSRPDGMLYEVQDKVREYKSNS